MRFLSIVWYQVLPSRFGGQKGIALFNKYLSAHEPLDCLCSKNNKPPDDITYKVIAELPNSKTQFFNPFCWKKIVDTARKQHSTHLILEHPYHGIAGFLVKTILKRKLIVHSHNIEYLRFKQLKKWWWKILQVYEGWTHRQADLSIFKTEADLERAVAQFKLQKTKCFVIPYGIEQTIDPRIRIAARKEMEQFYDIAPHEKILLFAGTLDYLPNAEAVEAIYTIIAPGLSEKNISFKIIICGRNRFPEFSYLNELSQPNVINAGEIEEIEKYFAAADVFINPVIITTGIQTKVIDALSFHCNVVCFENMITDIPLELLHEKIFMAPLNDWSAFIEQTIKGAKSFTQTPDGFMNKLHWDNLAKEFIAAIND